MMFISHIYICSTSENPVWIDKYVFMNFLNFDVTHLSRFFFVSETWARRMRNKFRKYLLMYELSWIAELLKIIFGVTPWFWRSRYMTFFHDFFYIFCTHVLRTLAKLSYIPLITYCYLQVFFFFFSCACIFLLFLIQNSSKSSMIFPFEELMKTLLGSGWPLSFTIVIKCFFDTKIKNSSTCHIK